MDGKKLISIVRLVCGPSNHSILGLAYFTADMSDGQAARHLRETVEQALADEIMNPWCRLCRSHSDKWFYLNEKTSFESFLDAEPQLRKWAAEFERARVMSNSRAKAANN